MTDEKRLVELCSDDGERRLSVAVRKTDFGGECVDIRGDFSLDSAHVAWVAGVLIGWLSKHQAIDDGHVRAAQHIIDRERRS